MKSTHEVELDTHWLLLSGGAIVCESAQSLSLFEGVEPSLGISFSTSASSSNLLHY